MATVMPDGKVYPTLPTMYDLPSEEPEEPGLPDEFHLYQPQLLRETFQPGTYPPERVFVGSDLNLYYYLWRNSVQTTQRLAGKAVGMFLLTGLTQIPLYDPAVIPAGTPESSGHGWQACGFPLMRE